ncbi:hypothetical protein M5D96_013830 [Drosophila gunungcola]|uniref:Uncharacterized protein n=1 Tax=Drosophila gunungcola TaxID=103775 RepID=A0A9P9YBB3_9MUSC|nr:hypothetical protein M5D96_013830 [Drosophila gunungcola]
MLQRKEAIKTHSQIRRRLRLIIGRFFLGPCSLDWALIGLRNRNRAPCGAYSLSVTGKIDSSTRPLLNQFYRYWRSQLDFRRRVGSLNRKTGAAS